MRLITAQARAFVYHGDWVAECPRPDCGNVEHLFDPVNPNVRGAPRTVPRPLFRCTYCGLADVGIEWPPERDMLGITVVLQQRPVPHTRNWFPADHRLAVATRVEHGQTVDDLVSENHEHEVY